MGSEIGRNYSWFGWFDESVGHAMQGRYNYGLEDRIAWVAGRGEILWVIWVYYV